MIFRIFVFQPANQPPTVDHETYRNLPTPLQPSVFLLQKGVSFHLG
jgi:hypothetical protein